MRNFRPLDLGVIKEHIERHAGSHDIFMDLAGNILGHGTAEHKIVERAAISIVEDFQGVRRHTGEQYVVHQRSVAVIGMMHSRIRDHRIIAADLLHDTVEDVEEATMSRIRDDYGRKVAYVVEGMTKPELPEQGALSDELFEDVCSQIIFKHVREHGIDCVKAKTRDRLHNMLTLWGSSEKKLKKIKETIQFLQPLSIRADYLWQELTMATSEQLARLHVDDTQV